MCLQKYRADSYEVQSDGAKVWFADWMGGASISKIENCRAINLHGEPRVTAYITGEPDTWFSTPAKIRYAGKTLNGYITGDDTGYDKGQVVFHHCYY